MQKVLFPEGLVYEGEAFRTAVTCLFFRDSAGAETGRYDATEFEMKRVPARTLPSWNQVGVWSRNSNALRAANQTVRSEALQSIEAGGSVTDCQNLLS